MKPNYCSGGTFPTGRISSSPTSLSSKGVKESSRSNENNEKLHLGGEQRQSQLQYRGNSLNYSISPSSPHFIVYRSAKYISPHARALQTLRSYAKFYVIQPAALFANRCKNAFYQLFGLLLLVILIPLWVLMIIGLFIVRRLRHLLISRLYPDLVQLGDYNSQISPASTPTESHGIVNSLIWIKGRIDANVIRQRFKLLFTENPQIYNLLRLKPVTKFGAKLWEDTPNFQLENHIVEAPKTYLNSPIVDEPLKELYRTGSNNKSLLQRYVSYCVSMPLDVSTPPWKIHIVSYISRDDGVKEKTCLVIRMHEAFIISGGVQGALRELFVNSQCDVGQKGDVNSNPIEIAKAPQTHDDKNDWNIRIVMDDLYSFVMQILSGDIWQRLNEFWATQKESVNISWNLRSKQLEFHSKAVVISFMSKDLKDWLRCYVCHLQSRTYEAWIAFICFIRRVITICQAFAAVPVIILASIVRRRQFQGFGLQRHAIPGRKLISWSDLIHGDLTIEICKKIGTSSPENVMLMACMNALKDYYQQNSMPTPNKIGFLVGNAESALEPSKAMKPIRIPVPIQNTYGSTPQARELYNLEEKVENFPEWKILGLGYISKYSHLFLPSALAYKVQQSIMQTYPFVFSYVNLKSDSVLNCGQDLLPVRQLYGEVVEDFTFWSLPPFSDLATTITLVRSTGKTRLFVMSPYQSMDTVLTHRCNQYLIKLAEDVGVDRSRIPYSRRSSPTSSNCSTPQILSCINAVDNLGFKSCLKRSESLSSAIY